MADFVMYHFGIILWTLVSSTHMTALNLATQMCHKYANNNDAICDTKSHFLTPGITTAAPREFPHMALIGVGDIKYRKWLCSGSLVSERFVISAAHCLYSKIWGGVKYVRLGELHKEKDVPHAEDPQDFHVEETYQPKDYLAPVFYNDIGLLKLDRAVVFNKFIRPACLFTQHEIPVPHAIVTGWGPREFGGADSDDLLKETVELVTDGMCVASYADHKNQRMLHKGFLPETQLCVTAVNGTYGGCQGQGGGPLQIYTKVQDDETYCMHQVFGIVIFGEAFGAFPTVFTRISAFIPWIENIVWN